MKNKDDVGSLLAASTYNQRKINPKKKRSLVIRPPFCPFEQICVFVSKNISRIVN